MGERPFSQTCVGEQATLALLGQPHSGFQDRREDSGSLQPCRTEERCCGGEGGAVQGVPCANAQAPAGEPWTRCRPDADLLRLQTRVIHTASAGRGLS